MSQVEEFLQEYDGGYIVTHNAEFDEVVHEEYVVASECGLLTEI